MEKALGGKIGVVIVDDHPVVRGGYEQQLASNPDMCILASLGSGRALLDWLRQRRRDQWPRRMVLIIDYELGPSEVDGLSLIQRIHTRYPDLRLLVGSVHASEATVKLTRRVGALGFYDKRQELGELTNAVRAVAAGIAYPDLEANAFDLPGATLSDAADEDRIRAYYPELTQKEHEVLRCYIQGMTVSQIASKLNRSIKTISTQKQSALRKMGIRSDMELARLRQDIDKT